MATLDMTLDDRIKSRSSRQSRGGGRGGRGGSGRGGRGGGGFRGRGFGGSFGRQIAGGPGRRGPLAVNTRPSAYSIAKSMSRPKRLPWQHDLFEDSLRAAGISRMEVGTKLYISNLDYGVTNDDIRELFSEMGEMKRYAIHFDKNGRPNGSAEVVYTRRSDAFQALKKYNNVLLDGKPMKIEIGGANEDVPISAHVNVTGVNGRRLRTVVMNPGSNSARAPAAVNRSSGRNNQGGQWRGRGLPNNPGRGRGWVRGRGRGRGLARNPGPGRGGRKQPVDKSVADLDKELDSYHAEAMQTS